MSAATVEWGLLKRPETATVSERYVVMYRNLGDDLWHEYVTHSSEAEAKKNLRSLRITKPGG